MPEQDLVTVVVPALDEERSIARCLESVRAQDHRNLQILVVDGGSSDTTMDVVRRQMDLDDRVELLRSSRRNIPTQLNVAVAQARGRWLVRVDAHSVIEPEHVRRVTARLAEGSWGGVGGRKDGVGHTPAGRAIAAAMASRFGVGNSTYHHGTQPQEVDHIPFGAYPLELVRSLGGWDERLSANEDYEFDYRLRQVGKALLFDPATTIAWDCRQSIRGLFTQYYRYGRGKADVARLHPESMSARHVVPPAFVAYCALCTTLFARHPARLAAALAPYLVAVEAASVPAGRDLESTKERLLVAPAFVAMHVGWGLGFWSRALPLAWDALREGAPEAR